MSSSTSTVPTLYQVDKLNNHNFTTWKFRLQMILKARKLWKYVDPGVIGLDADSQEKDQEALSQIALTVSDGVVGHIRNAKTAREAWFKICSVFEQKGLASQIFLRRKLINVKLDETQSMQSHINKIREIADQLEAIGDPVKDRELAIILLSSLPERYNALIISLEARPPDEITFDAVSSRLLAEEERQRESGDISIKTEGAFYSLGNKSGGFNRQRSLKECNFCHKKGHTEDRCWDKNGRPERNGSGSSNSNHANIAEVSEDYTFILGCMEYEIQWGFMLSFYITCSVLTHSLV